MTERPEDTRFDGNGRGDPGALDPELAKLVEDTRATDALEATFGADASARVLAKVRAATEPGAAKPLAATSKTTALAAVALLASLAILATLVGTQLVSERGRASPSAPALSTAAQATEPPAPTAESATPAPANIPLMRIDELPSSASSPSPSAPRAQSAKAPPPASDLAEEYRLVESARAALASKQPESALRAIHEYETRFPNGQLIQECESQHIQALVLAGRIEEARERAAKFRTRFPGGLLLPSVVRAIASSPTTPESR